MIHFRKVVHLLIDQGFQAIIWARDTRTFWNFPWWFSSFRLAFLLLFLSVRVMVSFIELSFLRVFFPRALGKKPEWSGKYETPKEEIQHMLLWLFNPSKLSLLLNCHFLLKEPINFHHPHHQLYPASLTQNPLISGLPNRHHHSPGAAKDGWPPVRLVCSR